MVVSSVVNAISDETGVAPNVIEQTIEVPPEVAFGDYAYPCFDLASSSSKNPVEAAEGLAASLDHGIFDEVSAQGPYVNMVLKGSVKLDAAATGVVKDEDDTVVVESPSPNTNKPLHFGHALNMVLGQSVSNILEAKGNTVVKENLYNDRGIHISKSMLAYQKEGDGQTPEGAGQKPDHFVGEYYVRYNELVDEDPSVEDEAQALLRAWEDGEEDVHELWSMMRDWCLTGIKTTIDDYGVRVDTDRFESDIYTDGRAIVEDGLDNEVFAKDDTGAVVADLTDVDLGKKHVLRSDNTTVYLTQDLALAKHRQDDVGADEVVYVVGKEQEYHFNCLFTLLDRLGIAQPDSLHHRSYGHVRLPEGAMSSREGTAIRADDIREEMISRAQDEVTSRHDGLDEDTVRERAEAIGMGALKFYLLRTDPQRDITFDPDESLSFTGETGPYVQYTYSRIQSMIDGVEAKDVQGDLLTSLEERNVLRVLLQFPERVSHAARTYDPSVIANYVLRLAQAFNEFYHERTVLVDEPVRGARIRLC